MNKTALTLLITIFGYITCLGQQREQFVFSLSDSQVFIGDLQITSLTKMNDLKQIFGKPSRIKRKTIKGDDAKTKWVSYIYDDLGVVFCFDKKDSSMVSIYYYFNRTLRSDPKTSFTQDIYLNGTAITKDDTRKSLKEKFPTFALAEAFGVCLFSNKLIMFMATFNTFGEKDLFLSFNYSFPPDKH